MTGRHGKNYDDSPEALRESVRKLSQRVASRFSDDDLARIGSAARVITAGLRETLTTGTPDEVASRVAMSIAALLSMVSQSPVGEAGDTLDHTIAGYSLAAAAALGLYELPPAPEGEHTHEHTDAPSGSLEDGELARPAGFRYL